MEIIKKGESVCHLRMLSLVLVFCTLMGVSFGDVQECSVEFEELEDVNPIVKVIREPTEATFECKLSRTTFLSLVCGRKVTNNWLKMHGGIMSRRKPKWLV